MVEVRMHHHKACPLPDCDYNPEAWRSRGDAIKALNVIDSIVDDTHPEGHGCSLCIALDELRDALWAPTDG